MRYSVFLPIRHYDLDKVTYILSLIKTVYVLAPSSRSISQHLQQPLFAFPLTFWYQSATDFTYTHIHTNVEDARILGRCMHPITLYFFPKHWKWRSIYLIHYNHSSIFTYFFIYYKIAQKYYYDSSLFPFMLERNCFFSYIK